MMLVMVDFISEAIICVILGTIVVRYKYSRYYDE